MAKKKRQRKGPGGPSRPRPPVSRPSPRSGSAETGRPPPPRGEPVLDVELVPGQVETLIGLVTTGALDPYLPQLTNAIDRRQREVVRARSIRALGEFAVGDRVRINRHIRPLYLRNATGTVTGWSGQRVVVHLDQAAGRLGAGEVRVPPLGLDRLATAA